MMEVNSQKGYTLAELLVIIAVIGFISGVTALTFSLVSKLSVEHMADNIIFSQVHQAASWITRDVQSSENVTQPVSGTWNCSMKRYVYNGVDNITLSQIDYVITNGVLYRSVDGTDGKIIASFLSNPGTDTTFVKSTSENNTYILTVKAVYNNYNFSRVYKINQRIAEN